MKRSKHSLSHYRLISMDMGQLIPIAWFEALPGDSVQAASSALIRMKPMLAPVMHPISVRIHHWFVPNRLIWANWEKFITGGSDGEGDGSAWPYFNNPTPGAGELGDYLGLPVGVAVGQVSALPARAYSLIFNEFYRDADLVSERAISTADGADATTSLSSVASIAWEKDYFTSARPWPQKGPSVTLPLGTEAPIVYSHENTSGWQAKNATTGASYAPGGAENLNLGATGGLANQAVNLGLQMDPMGNLLADLSSATAVDVNTVREAFALQRYQEARALYGHRYTEYLRYLGVRSSDARLQRPEYLGGGKQTLAISEVLQVGTNFDANNGVGTMRGHGIAAMRSRRYRRFFEEHGIVMSVMSVRPRTMYFEGTGKQWTRSAKEQYFQKELEHIGQDEVLNKEIYAAGASPTAVFGYQDRYAEYRHIQSGVAGEFRNSDLNFWHLARDFAAAPALNSSFVTCDPGQRIFAEQVKDSLWVMVNNHIQARRPVSKGGMPGRIV